jgi:hypothetical protein
MGQELIGSDFPDRIEFPNRIGCDDGLLNVKAVTGFDYYFKYLLDPKLGYASSV